MLIGVRGGGGVVFTELTVHGREGEGGGKRRGQENDSLELSAAVTAPGPRAGPGEEKG